MKIHIEIEMTELIAFIKTFWFGRFCEPPFATGSPPVAEIKEVK